MKLSSGMVTTFEGWRLKKYTTLYSSQRWIHRSSWPSIDPWVQVEDCELEGQTSWKVRCCQARQYFWSTNFYLLSQTLNAYKAKFFHFTTSHFNAINFSFQIFSIYSQLILIPHCYIATLHCLSNPKQGINELEFSAKIRNSLFPDTSFDQMFVQMLKNPGLNFSSRKSYSQWHQFRGLGGHRPFKIFKKIWILLVLLIQCSIYSCISSFITF